MIDPKLLRQNPEALAAQLARRGFKLDTQLLARLEAERRENQLKAQELQTERNQFSKAIGQAKAKGEDVSELLAKVANLGENLAEAESKLEAAQQALEEFQLQLPNLLDASVPEGGMNTPMSKFDDGELRRFLIFP